VRRGTDVITALALGARAVLVGRPYLYGLAAAGQRGVEHSLTLLYEEIALALRLLGRTSVCEIDSSVLQALPGQRAYPAQPDVPNSHAWLAGQTVAHITEPGKKRSSGVERP